MTYTEETILTGHHLSQELEMKHVQQQMKLVCEYGHPVPDSVIGWSSEPWFWRDFTDEQKMDALCLLSYQLEQEREEMRELRIRLRAANARLARQTASE